MSASQPYFADALGRLGRLKVSLGEYSAAEDFFRKELDIREKFIGEGMDEFLRCRINLARSCSYQFKSHEVINTLDGYLPVILSEFNESPTVVKHVYLLLGKAKRLLRLHEDALVIMNSAMKMVAGKEARTTYGDFSLFMEMARLQYAMKNLETSGNYYAEIIARKPHFKLLLANAHAGLGSILHSQNNPEQAKKHLHEALPLFMKTYKSAPTALVNCAVELAGIYENELNYLSGLGVLLPIYGCLINKQPSNNSARYNIIKKIEALFLYELAGIGANHGKISQVHLQIANLILAFYAGGGTPDEILRAVTDLSNNVKKGSRIESLDPQFMVDEEIIAILVRSGKNDEAGNHAHMSLQYYSSKLGPNHDYVARLHVVINKLKTTEG